jgi:hypothetical protein
MWADIHSKIMTANQAYSAYIKLLRPKLLSRNTKLKIYKTLIRPILTYGSETWTLTTEEMNAIRISERKIIRKIYGPIKEGDSQRIRTNKEIKDIFPRGRYCKIYKILQNKMVWTCRKDTKPKNAKTNCSGYNRRNKERGRTRLKRT